MFILLFAIIALNINLWRLKRTKRRLEKEKADLLVVKEG